MSTKCLEEHFRHSRDLIMLKWKWTSVFLRMVFISAPFEKQKYSEPHTELIQKEATRCAQLLFWSELVWSMMNNIFYT